MSSSVLASVSARLTLFGESQQGVPVVRAVRALGPARRDEQRPGDLAGLVYRRRHRPALRARGQLAQHGAAVVVPGPDRRCVGQHGRAHRAALGQRHPPRPRTVLPDAETRDQQGGVRAGRVQPPQADDLVAEKLAGRRVRHLPGGEPDRAHHPPVYEHRGDLGLQHPYRLVDGGDGGGRLVGVRRHHLKQLDQLLGLEVRRWRPGHPSARTTSVWLWKPFTPRVRAISPWV
jgi:hypothetical protein